jgi:hypothetical protein
VAFETIQGSDRANNTINRAATKNLAGQYFMGVDVFSPNEKVLPVQLTGSGQVIPSTVGQTIYVTGLILSSPSAGSVQFSSISGGSTVTLSPALINLEANRPLVLIMAPLFICPESDAFGLGLTGISSLGVIARYRLF